MAAFHWQRKRPVARRSRLDEAWLLDEEGVGLFPGGVVGLHDLGLAVKAVLQLHDLIPGEPAVADQVVFVEIKLATSGPGAEGGLEFLLAGDDTRGGRHSSILAEGKQPVLDLPWVDEREVVDCAVT